MTTNDLSNHDLSTFDPACMKAAGVDRVIVGCWDLAATLTIVAGCRDVGVIAEDLYAFLYFGHPWEQRESHNAKAVADQLGGIAGVWLDVEADPPHEAPGLTAEHRFDATWEARERAITHGADPGIYTGAYYWIPKMANTRIFADLGDPLWVANWGTNDPNNPRPPLTSVNFGGWSRPAVHQYSSMIPVCGRRRDHNYWMHERGTPMTPEELARLERLEKLVAGYGIAKDPAAYVASGYHPSLLTFGPDALAYADEKQWSAFLGVGLAREEAAKAQATADAGGAPGGPHTHSEYVTRDEVEAGRLDLPGDGPG